MFFVKLRHVDKARAHDQVRFQPVTQPRPNAPIGQTIRTISGVVGVFLFLAVLLVAWAAGAPLSWAVGLGLAVVLVRWIWRRERWKWTGPLDDRGPAAVEPTRRQLDYLKRLADDAGQTVNVSGLYRDEVSGVIAALQHGRDAGRLVRQLERKRPARRQRLRKSAQSIRNAWSNLLERSDVLIIDTETTGLGDRAEVLEIAVIDTTGAVRCNLLSLPQGRIPSNASAKHGLTRKELTRLGAPAWPEIHGEVQDALKDARVALAWNLPFDLRLLRQTTERHGLTWAHMKKVQGRDLLDDYRALRPHDPHGLTHAVEREGARFFGDAHRALADCHAALAVMRAVVE